MSENIQEYQKSGRMKIISIGRRYSFPVKPVVTNKRDGGVCFSQYFDVFAWFIKFCALFEVRGVYPAPKKGAKLLIHFVSVRITQNDSFFDLSSDLFTRITSCSLFIKTSFLERKSQLFSCFSRHH